MKKVIVSILLIIMFFNLISPIISYATEGNGTSNASEEYNQLLNGDTRPIISNGVKREEKTVAPPTRGGMTANVLVNITTAIFFTISSALSSLVSEPTEAYVFTVYDAVFNEVPAFDANYLIKSDNSNNIHTKIKEQVEIWYGAIRRIAIALSLCVLIYVGIRMAISTVSEDKAKYKKMLVGWLQAFVLIFFMHYIILFSTMIAKTLLDLIKLMPVNESAETKIFWATFFKMFGYEGWDALSTSIVYWILVFYQVKFFMLYAKRMLAVAFLIIISPLITVTYPIDKIGDRKSTSLLKLVPRV